MKISSAKLIEEMIAITEHSRNAAEKFKSLDNFHLNFKQNPPSWSILECIEHLNLYGDFYLPEIGKQLINQKNANKSTFFKSGILGNYFANLMKVQNGKIRKMKSPKDKDPSTSELNFTTIDRFLKQLNLLKSLLHQAESVDLTKTKTAISLSPLIKLRLGDTLRFFVFHIERHLLQASRVLENSEVKEKLLH